MVDPDYLDYLEMPGSGYFSPFSFYGARGIGHDLVSINLTLWMRLFLWERWTRHGGKGCWDRQG